MTTFKEAQEKLGLTNAQAAKICGKNIRTIERWRSTGKAYSNAVIMLENSALFLKEESVHE